MILFWLERRKSIVWWHSTSDAGTWFFNLYSNIFKKSNHDSGVLHKPKPWHKQCWQPFDFLAKGMANLITWLVLASLGYTGCLL